MSPIATYRFEVEEDHIAEVYDLLYFCAKLETEVILDRSKIEGDYNVMQIYRREDSLVEVYFKDKKKHTLGTIIINYFLTEDEEKFVEANPGITPPFLLDKFNKLIGFDI